jgi:2-polyprenyl-6-hydroxyphenyl methylase/3-demethylubiquinone-9 3-methyltransferase
MSGHGNEIESNQRFNFGENWTNFLTEYDQLKLDSAVKSLKSMFGIESFQGKTFLDIGSGSGLLSLAARTMGATVTSFDYDPQSVACTLKLKNLFFADDVQWNVLEGSILDSRFLSSLSRYDYVYSWGVLHHTGSMWDAITNAQNLVNDQGSLLIAIYNKQKIASSYWLQVKKLYLNHRFSRPIFIAIHGLYPVIPSYLFRKIQSRPYPRGMSIWYDLIDWLGGYPFEVASPEEIVDFMVLRGFVLRKITTVGGNHGCNEFIFSKI